MKIIKFILLTFLFLVQTVLADEVYLTAGLAHLSAIQTGAPVNDKPETAYDSAFVGLEYYHSGLDLVLETELVHIFQDDEIHGNNPRIQFRVTKKVRIFQN